jgi:hypothetical protein
MWKAADDPGERARNDSTKDVDDEIFQDYDGGLLEMRVPSWWSYSSHLIIPCTLSILAMHKWWTGEFSLDSEEDLLD